MKENAEVAPGVTGLQARSGDRGLCCSYVPVSVTASLRQLSLSTHESPAQQLMCHSGPRCFMEAKSEILDQVLLKLPGMEQSTPVENTEFIRFTVRLHTDPLDNCRQPEIFILFTHNDLEQARSTHDGLERAFWRNIRRHSFKDEINGATVETSIQKDHSGVWRALTVDGVKRMFDKSRDLWVRDSAAFAG
jgi:hypothetical protein